MSGGRPSPARTGWIALRIGGALAAFVVALVLILRSTSTSIYGFAVSADPFLLTERGLQIGPLLAALATMPVIGLADGRLAAARHGLDAGPVVGTGPAIAMGLLWNAIVPAAVFTAATVATIGLFIIHHGGAGLPTGTPQLVAGYFFDLVLVMVLVQFLHALTRRWYLTLTIFIAYAVLVIVLGSSVGSVDLIGFGTTPPVTIVGHDDSPIGVEAAWMWRSYWLSVTLVLAVLMLAFYDPPRPLLAFRTASPRPARSTTRALLAVGVLIGISTAAGYALSMRKRAVAIRYPEAVDALARGVAVPSGRPTLIRFDGVLDARLSERRIDVGGTQMLRNDTAEPLAVVTLEKAQLLRLTQIAVPGGLRWRTSAGARMVLIELARPIRPGETRAVRYRGSIDASDPFDIAARSLVMPHAFFLQTASILPLPRRPACFAGPKQSPSCVEGENYQLSDAAAGRITVTAPADLVVPSARRSRSPDGRVRSVVIVAPRNLVGMLISASRYRIARVAASDLSPAVTVYGAPYGGDPLDRVGVYARDTFRAYARLWGSAPLRKFWIAETPPSLFDATAYGDGLAISERYMGRRARESDMISEATRMILSHEVAHQWWGYTLVPTKGPGSAFVLESFPQFAGLARLYQNGVIDRRTLMAREEANVAIGVRVANEPKQPLYRIEEASWRAYHEGPLALARLDEQVGGTLLARMGAVLRMPKISGMQSVRPATVVDALIDQVPEQPAHRTRRTLTAAR